MRLLPEVWEEFQDVREALKAFEGRELDEYSGPWLMRNALEERRTLLTQEILLAKGPRLDLAFEGPPVQLQSIRVDFLTRALTSFQDALSAVGQALTGPWTSRGLIPGEVREATALHFVGAVTGSFGVALKGPSAESLGVLDVVEGPSLFEKSVGTVFDVVAAAEADDLVPERVAQLGPRALGHLGSFSALLAAERVVAKMLVHSMDSEQRALTFRPSAAGRLAEFLAGTETEERQIRVRGRLVGASLVRGRFELETEEGTILSGPVDPRAVDNLPSFFSGDCVATLRVSVVRTPADGEEAEAYALLALE